MKRILLSLIGGFLLPLGYLSIAVPIALLLPQYKLAGDKVPGLLFVPVFFAINIHEALCKRVALPAIFNSDIFRAIELITSILGIYTGLSYLILTAISRFQGKLTKEKLPPPQPPLFADER